MIEQLVTVSTWSQIKSLSIHPSSIVIDNEEQDYAENNGNDDNSLTMADNAEPLYVGIVTGMGKPAGLRSQVLRVRVR
jgi:hypothetical protein